METSNSGEVSPAKRALVSIGVGFVRLVLLIWDVVSLPAYAAVYKPWAVMSRAKRDRSRVISRTDTQVTFEAVPYSCSLRREILSLPPERALNTLTKIWDFGVQRHGDRDCLGTREVFGEESETQPDGKVFVKLLQGDYSWLSYLEAQRRVMAAARGLADLGLRPGDRVAIYADTKADWLIAALGCFKNSVGLVTLYTNLGEDGVQFGIEQTRVKTVITSQDLLPRLAKILDKVPLVETIVYMESAAKKEINFFHATGHQLVPFGRLIEIGEKSTTILRPPTPEDVAIIMYTSGSVGVPKGVVLTHANMVAACMACCSISCDILGEDRSDDEAYIAYLPLAHIFELTLEIIVLLMGVRVGYSGPNTLTDMGTMIKTGQKGDATTLCPTAMAAVPVILDRIYKGIRAKVRSRGYAFNQLFELFFEYRLRWIRRGFDTPILNRVVFAKMRAALGGKLRLIVGGGAPLSGDVHDFLRTCLCVRLVQGYGLTETVGGCSLADRDDMSTGRVGKPLMGVKIGLVNWEDGGYTVNDREGPRGEVVVGGLVGSGYFELPDKTEESFLPADANGDRWFITGDVGQLMPDGTLKIIDRKKDLVKLQFGEYVALGKVEAWLKVHPMVESVCVYVDSHKVCAVALVVPDDLRLRELARAVGADERQSREALCADPRLIRAAADSLVEHGQKKLEKFEVPRAYALVAEQWLPETGLVTAAFKLKRKAIQAQYQHVIDELYGSLDGNNGVPKIKVH